MLRVLALKRLGSELKNLDLSVNSMMLSNILIILLPVVIYGHKLGNVQEIICLNSNFVRMIHSI